MCVSIPGEILTMGPDSTALADVDGTRRRGISWLCEQALRHTASIRRRRARRWNSSGKLGMKNPSQVSRGPSETTPPTVSHVLRSAEPKGFRNFTVLSAHKALLPAM